MVDLDCQYANSCTTTHTLPFTGADLVLFVIIGVAVIACGLALRWRSE